MANPLHNIDPDVNYFVSNDDCSYYDAESFNTLRYNVENTLKIIHINIRAANSNFDEFLLFLSSLKTKFSIIVLTETWLNHGREWVDIAGYRSYHSVREGKRGGGVTILVDEGLVFELCDSLSVIDPLFETCAVEMRSRNSRFIVLGVYRPPGNSIHEFNEHFFPFLDRREIISSKSFILGDFNVDLNVSEDDNVSSFINEFRSLHFLPKITLPTRVTASTATCIDHVWVNTLQSCRPGIFSVNISDHYPIFIVAPCAANDRGLSRIEFRCCNADNIRNFVDGTRSLVAGFSRYQALDVHLKCKLFCDKLFAVYNEACPVKTKLISCRRLENPWLTDGLLRCINRKHQLYKQYLAGEIDHSLCQEYKNILSMAIKTAKKKYYSNAFDSSLGSSRKTWQNIKTLMKSASVKPKDITVELGNETSNDPKRVSNAFNDYFISIADRLAENIPPSNVDPLRFLTPQCNSFVCLPTDSNEVCRVIRSFPNKGCPPNAIPSFCYKHVAEMIAPIICDLINCSFESGEFPDILKIARVIPIFKAGSKSSLCNYRPISTLHFISKIFERVMYSRLDKYICRFNLLTDGQFGFRKDLSTSDAVLQFTDAVYNTFNSKKYLISVLLDFSKAFDTVNHSILLSKLQSMGVRGSSLAWFRSYLSNRKQYVSLLNTSSELKNINAGVPQGSIIGPLLFLIYINDMSKCSCDLKFVHFADDTTALIDGSNLDHLLDKVNCELHKIDDWLRTNKLSLNVEKSSYLIFSNCDKSSNKRLAIRGSPLSLVNSAKFLGVMIDDRLSFKLHLNYVCDKISKSIGVMRKLSAFLPVHVLEKLYFSLIYPHLVYCVVVWGSSCRTGLARLHRLQNRTLRLLCRAPDQSSEMCKHRKFLSISQIYQYFVAIKCYQYYILGNSNYFLVKYVDLHVNHSHATRSQACSLLVNPFVPNSKFTSSFFYQSIKIWNNLPLETREVLQLSYFRKMVRNLLLY